MSVVDALSFVPELERFEGSVAHMYRDSADAGNVTVGIGCMLPSLAAALSLPFQWDGRDATAREIRDDWARVLRMPPALAARAYRSATSVLLSQAQIRALAVRRLETEFLPGLRRLMPGFDAFPRPAQSAFVDLVWNLGIGAPATPARRATGLQGFPTLLRYAAAGRWDDCAIECRRSSARPERNAWTRAQFEAAAAPAVA